MSDTQPAGARTRPITVFQWAQEPGPVGGVTHSVQDLTAALREDGVRVSGVNTADPRAALRMLPRIWGPRSMHVVHITRLWRAVVLAPLFVLLPGHTVLVLHSGSTRRQVEALRPLRAWLLSLALHAYDELWAVNGEIGSLVPERLVRRVRVVSPFVPGTPPPVGERDPDLVTVATNSGLEHYGAELALAAMEAVRETRPAMRLWVLAYGDEGPQMRALREKVAGLAWVSLSFNLTPPQVVTALAGSGVFLRPTSWDGDALIVREALSVGTRVIASDAAARPAGVELSTLDPDALAAALLYGGRVSDGEGLASESVVDVARRSLAVLCGA